MTDETFERDLRAMLTARDPGSAPTALDVVVRSQIRDADRTWTAPWSRVLASFGAVAALLLVIAVAAMVMTRSIPAGPGASAPDPTPPYVLQPGDGVVTGDHQPVVQSIAMFAAFFALIIIASQTRARRKRIGATVGALLVALVALNIGTSDAVEFRDGAYGVDPGRVDPQGGMPVAVDGDGPFTLIVTLTNTSRMPLTILGLAPRPTQFVLDEPLGPRLVGLGSLPPDSFAIESVTRFTPTTLSPGEQIHLIALGFAGPCSLAVPPADTYTVIEMETIPLLYEQLTIVHPANVTLPEPAVFTGAGTCHVVAP